MIYAICGLLAVFGFRRLMFCMKFFQQAGYYNDRFLRFALRGMRLADRRVFLPFLAAAIVNKEPWSSALPIAALALQIAREKNPMRGAIKPLNMTGRARRIFWTAFVLWLGAVALRRAVPSPDAGLYYHAGLVLLAPAFLMIAKFLMRPADWLINRRYIGEARAKLRKFAPAAIGITGSFGKTSLKNILNHILSSCSTSFAARRSINTLMGIARVIREEYSAPTRYFVAEMGVGDVGQMPALARLVNPASGIITAVGAAHLENFKTMDRVAREKFKLSARVAKNGGRTILNGRNIAPEFIKKYAAPDDMIFSGDEISDVRQTMDGLSFVLSHDGARHEIFAPIYGIHQAENIALAFIAARNLGASADAIVTALKTLGQTEHRLEVRREGGLTVIDDAFNSNANGFASALETGAAIRGGGRLILITPGMVELGALHADQHRRIGGMANGLCDVVVAVRPDRIRDFTDQIAPGKLVRVQNLAAAREWLGANARAGDVVLYENDLPDAYIEKVRL